MKKYKLLKISVILLILFFLDSWYGDELVNSLLLFSLLTTIPLLVAYVICWRNSIKELIKNHKTIINYLPVIVLITTAILLFNFPFRIAKVKLELMLYKNERTTVIQMVEDGELEAGRLGNIELPIEYKQISTSGEILVYQNNKEGTVIGFWVSRGMLLSGSVVLIYSTGGEQLIEANLGAHSIKSIEKLKDTWFYVITN